MAAKPRPDGVERIRSYLVWDNNRDMVVDEGANAADEFVIAVIDTGIDYYTSDSQNVYHPDLKDNVAGGRGFMHYWWSCELIENDNYADDREGLYRGHGTHVAGIITAVDNEIGVIGTAPKAIVYSLKLHTRSYKELAAAINYAANTLRAEIITMSLGETINHSDVKSACDNAYANGALLFAAASSWGESFVRYPARYDSVVAVGAVYLNGTRWEKSNFGPELEFVAPGVDIYSTFLDEGYAEITGTSMACPHVAAVAALIWSSKIDPAYDADGNGVWSNTEVRQKLRHLALDLGPPGRDDEYGYGLINGWATCQRPLGAINNDHAVDGLDLSIASRAFGSYPSHPKWDPRADVNIDNFVDGLDITIIAKNYGKTADP